MVLGLKLQVVREPTSYRGRSSGVPQTRAEDWSGSKRCASWTWIISRSPRTKSQRYLPRLQRLLPGDGPFLQVGMIVYGTPMKWTPFHPPPWDYPVAPCTDSLVSAEPGSQLKRFCRSGTPAECFSILRRTPPHLLASYGRETVRMTQHQSQGTQMSERCRRLSTATTAPPSIQPCYR